MHNRLVGAQLDVEVLPVRTRGHGGAEDGLDEEGVVRLQGAAVGVAEGDGELLGGGFEVRGEREAGEFEAARGGTTLVCGDGRMGGEGERGLYRTSHTRPSVAVCLPVLSSLMTSSWRVSDSSGAASCLSLIFWLETGLESFDYAVRVKVRGAETLTFPNISFLTGLKATDPRISAMVSVMLQSSFRDCEYQTTW